MVYATQEEEEEAVSDDHAIGPYCCRLVNDMYITVVSLVIKRSDKTRLLVTDRETDRQQ